MKYTQFRTADEFLERMGAFFEHTEALNGLMFGIALQLTKNRFKYGKQEPLLAIVEDAATIHLAALMTPPHKLQLCTPTSFSDDSLEILVHELREHAWDVPGLIAEHHLAKSFGRAWMARQTCLLREGMQQRIHELRHVQPLEYAHGTFRQAGPQDMELAIAWAHAFHRDCFGHDEPGRATRNAEHKISNGELFFWTNQAPVSMVARTRPTPHGESIGFVYTPPEYRQRGYATAVVASLSQRILDDGKHFCCLYTDLANPTSNSIYRKIGYVPVADVMDIHFDV